MPHGHFSSRSLLMDLYELTMAASYFEHREDSLASFELFIRKLPARRSFFLALGIHDAIDFLHEFRFKEEEIDYLKGLNIFADDFLQFLSTLRFHGNLWAVPEGTVVFPNEPILRVVAPIIEAQIFESIFLNLINVQTTIGTKAARAVLAARDKSLFDFSLRRTHGLDAALKAARASYVAGFHGTSNLLAGKLYGIPVVGTMAHSFIMSFNDELESFRAFVDTFPKYSTLLVDTYDSIQGVEHAIIIAHELEKKGHSLRAIRIDSGNLARTASRARFLLDKAGLSYVKIFASGNLDEYAIDDLAGQKAPIDSFGVGTKIGVSADAPYCDVIYKLTEITDINGEFLPTMKLSEGKVTYPGRKQIYRVSDKQGSYKKDILGLEKEEIKGNALLVKMIDNGVIIYNQPSLKQVRDSVRKNLSRLPKALKRLKNAKRYQVEISPELKYLTRQVSQKIKDRLEKY